MAAIFNPWDHAQEIAHRLARPDAEFLTVVGAAGWCKRCQSLRPKFETLSKDLPSHIVPLWLDLEEHAEFLDDFIPPDLPLLLRWRQGRCIQAAIIEGISDAPGASRVDLRTLAFEGTKLLDPNVGQSLELPALWEKFAV
jgi:thiol-disulfide isomerase/thioredoxin